MQPSVFTSDTLSNHYTTAVDALWEIAHTSFFLGRMEQALHTLQTSLHLIEANEVAPKDRLKLLLLYGKVLTVDHLIRRDDPDLLFATIRHAQQLAESLPDQQGLADALSLLGQAHCNATTVAILKRGALPFGAHEQGYEDALTVQQQALTLQETLHDTRGISESQFGIGLVYQFWQQHDLARTYITKALQTAEQARHL